MQRLISQSVYLILFQTFDGLEIGGVLRDEGTWILYQYE